MDKIIDRIYSNVIWVTSIITFLFWKVAGWLQSQINAAIGKELYSMVGTYILGVFISYSSYILISKMIIFLCEKYYFIKKFFYKEGLFVGKWVGSLKYKDETRLLIVDIDQTINSINFVCDVYSLNEEYLGNMNSDSANFDISNKKFWASYVSDSKNRVYSMNGLINMNYRLDKNRIPSEMKGYAYQIMINEKCMIEIYKVPQKENISNIIEYYKLNYLNKMESGGK